MTMKKIIRATLFTPTRRGWGLTPLFWGPPGVGKSAIVAQSAAGLGLPIEVLSPGERGEGAFGVVPVPVEGRLTYPRPDWTDSFAEGRGIVFVDEMTTAAPALQPALLGLLLDGRIGTYTLPRGVRLVGAANPPEQAAGGYDLSPPQANRLLHLDWEAPTVDELQAFLVSGAIGDEGREDPAEIEAMVEATWPEAFAASVGRVGAFLAANSRCLLDVPAAGDPAATRAWPSPRSWEMATRADASARIHGLDDADRETLVRGCVGESADELFAFLEHLDLPDPAEILDGGVAWSHDSKRLDVTHAVFASCTALVVPRDAAHRAARAAKLWELLVAMRETDAFDLCVPALHALVRANLHVVPGATRVLAGIQPILELSGVTI